MTGAAAERQRQQQERERERAQQAAQQAYMTALSQRRLAEKLAAVAAQQATDAADVEQWLALALSAAARLLEALLGNVETSKVFVQKGGVDVLLRLYLLPKLPVSVGHPVAVGGAHNSLEC